jgi:hypothetical protein
VISWETPMASSSGNSTREPLGELLGAPRHRPASVLPAPVAPPDPAHLQAWDRHAARGGDHPREPILHLVAGVSLVASLVSLGRLDRRSACHCAVVARYSRRPPRVAALRHSSRETVDGDRPSRPAISQTPQWRAGSRASLLVRQTTGSAPTAAQGQTAVPSRHGSQNQRTPTAGDPPAAAPASSLEDPRPTASQNRCLCWRRPTGGRPGDRHGRPSTPARAHRNPSLSGCCDDRLNPPNTWPSATPSGSRRIRRRRLGRFPVAQLRQRPGREFFSEPEGGAHLPHHRGR